MCALPRVSPAGGIDETPIGEGAYEAGELIGRRDLPMLLQTFEYVACSVLQAWWHEMAQETWTGATPVVDAPQLHNRGVIVVNLG